MEKITARYQSPNWVLNLQVNREDAPINTRNPFFPLNLKGQVRMPDITPNIEIAGGTYDFYTGKIAIRLVDGTEFVGARESRSRLFLKRPTPGIARPLQPHVPVAFTLMGQ